MNRFLSDIISTAEASSGGSGQSDPDSGGSETTTMAPSSQDPTGFLYTGGK